MSINSLKLFPFKERDCVPFPRIWATCDCFNLKNTVEVAMCDFQSQKRPNGFSFFGTFIMEVLQLPCCEEALAMW